MLVVKKPSAKKRKTEMGLDDRERQKDDEDDNDDDKPALDDLEPNLKGDKLNLTFSYCCARYKVYR